MLTLLVIALIVSGCGSNGQPTAVTSLAGAGATFPYPLYSKVFDTYDAATGVRVNYNSIGSGGGIKALTDKTVDFGAFDAFLTDQEDLPWERLSCTSPRASGPSSYRTTWTETLP